MRTALVAWGAQYTAIQTDWRRDRSKRLIFYMTLPIKGGAAYLFFVVLQRYLSAVPAPQGMGGPKLWPLALSIEATLILAAIFYVYKQGFGGNEPYLNLTLPVRPAERFRSLAGLVFLTEFGQWAVGLVLLTSSASLNFFGINSLPWVAVFTLGAPLAIFVSLLLVFFSVLYILPQTHKIMPAALAGGIGVAVLARRGLFPALEVGVDPHPLWASLAILTLLLLFAGPMADFCGRLYEKALLASGQTRWHASWALPGVTLITAILARRRGLTAALLTKEFLSRTRSPITPIRIVILTAGLLSLPYATKTMVANGVPQHAIPIIITLLLVQFTLNELAINGVAGEGDRFTIYAVFPLDLPKVLTSMLLVFLLPILFEGLVLTVACAMAMRLTPLTLAYSLAFSSLALLGNTVLLVWGGAADQNFKTKVQGSTAMILQEEVFVTPVRVLVFVASILFQALALSLAWVLPRDLSLISIIAIDFLVIVSLRYWSISHLRGLATKGLT